MPLVLEAENLEAQYGATKVLHGLGFTVEAGGITAILGANGAGKTTTLRAVCGMVRTAGSVRFEGQRIDGKATEEIVRLGIAHAPEGRGTFMDLTVQENLRLGAYVRKDRGASRETSSASIQYFPILGQRQRQPGTRSRAASSRCWRGAPSCRGRACSARRAFARPGAARHAGDLPHRAHDQQGRGRQRPAWSSRTPRWRSARGPRLPPRNRAS
jgi:ABC-type sugar transport system ATPase subunit